MPLPAPLHTAARPAARCRPPRAAAKPVVRALKTRPRARRRRRRRRRYGNGYLWDYFLVATCFSVVGVLLWVIPAQLLKRFFGIEGPGVSGVLARVPGWRFFNGEWAQDNANAAAKLRSNAVEPEAEPPVYSADKGVPTPI